MAHFFRLSFFRTSFCRASICLSAALLFLSPHAASSSELAVYVCIDARGRATYQGEACAEGQRTRGVRIYQNQTIDPALVARTRAIEQEMDRRNRGGAARGTRARKFVKSPADPCKTAKARRKAMLDRAGVNRGYAVLEEIDLEVWGLCKGL